MPIGGVVTKAAALRSHASDLRHASRSRDQSVAVTSSTAAVIAAVPALLDLWEACEAERDAQCWSRGPDDKNRSCACGTQENTRRCPVTLAHAVVDAVLSKGLP